jgi:hypothetical protein
MVGRANTSWCALGRAHELRRRADGIARGRWRALSLQPARRELGEHRPAAERPRGEARRDYFNYDKVDGFEDKASAARWRLPRGYRYRLFEDKGPCRGRHVDLPELRATGSYPAQAFKGSPEEATENVELMYRLAIAAAEHSVSDSRSVAGRADLAA